MTAALRSDWHRVGAGLSVRFDMADGRIEAEWLPTVPTKREWKRVIDRYRVARHKFLAACSVTTGREVLCIELSGLTDGGSR